jgi:two-component system sensor histidine kinase/response regulator
MLATWQSIVDTMAGVIGVPAGLIMRLGEQDIEVLVSSHTADNPYHPGDAEHFAGSGLYCETVVREQKPLLVPNALADDHWRNNPDIRLDMVSYLGFPIRWPNQRPFGTICVLDRKENAFSEPHQRLVAQFRDLIEGQLAFVHDESRRSSTRASTRFDDLLSLLPHLVYEARMSPEDGTVTLLYASERGAATVFEVEPVSRDPVTFLLDDFFARVHPDDRRDAWQHWCEQTRAVAPYQAQYRLLLPNGDVRWVDSRAEPSREPDGHVLWHGVVSDITAHREAQRALDESEAQHQAVLERLQLAIKAGGVGIWEADFETGGYLFNEQMHEIYGVGATGFRSTVPPEIFGGNVGEWMSVIHPDDVVRVMDVLDRARLDTSFAEYEHRIVRASGEIRHVRSAAQIVHDEQGVAKRGIGTTLDVTEWERLTAALRTERERVVLAARAGGIGIWDLDLAADRFTWDEQMHALYGLRPGDFPGTLDAWATLIDPDDVPRIVADWTRAVDERGTFEAEFRIVRPSGERRHLRAIAKITAAPDGALARAIGINWDVTAERQAGDALRAAKEAAESAEQTKSEFLAMMSHEIRSPMNAILGMTRLALLTELTPKQYNYLSKIDLSARALIVILNDILDFSKIEARKLHLEETEFSIESMLESVAAVTAVKAEEKGLEIAFAIAPDVPARLVGDPLRLGQVLINLVNNAVKFTEHGEVVVSMELAEAMEVDRATLRVAVRDTGIGLKPEQQAGLFQAFTQGDSHITREYGGTGLGLAISKQLVEMMGGRIWAAGEPGVGSTFTFTIQARRPAQPEARPPDAVSDGLRGRRVLVVDDNASAREILALMVRRFGMHTGVTDSGPSAMVALKLAARGGAPFDLVLMDWRMPGMDGLEAARLIKGDADLSRTPAVLMVTAFGREEILLRAEQLHLEGVLIKPVTDSVLFNTIAEALGCARADQEPGDAASRRRVPEPRGVVGLAGRRVLVVDDNALNREVATDFLLAAGMWVEAAAGGLEALERLRDGAYDAVLMDVHMPGMDGLTATREIRRDPRLARLPIVALTAQAQAADRGASLAAGMNAHLTKPIDETALYGTLLQLLVGPVAIAAAASDGDAGGAAADRDTAWPLSLPGIDLSIALARLGGRRERVLRFLRGFVRDFAEAPARLSEDYAAGRREDIVTVAHTVKSAAGYLGAIDLADAAALLEAAARRGDDEAMAERVVVFREYLEAVLAALQSLFAQTPRIRPRAASDAASLGASLLDAPADAPLDASMAAPVDSPMDATAASIVARLAADAEPLVIRGDYAALALLDEIGARLAGTPAAVLAETARDQFEEVELESATATLRQLQAALARLTAQDGE